MTDDPLLNDFKSHIEFEDGMDDRLFNQYLKTARSYVLGATSKQNSQTILMVAALLNDFRVPEKDLSTGLDALTPFFVQEVMTDAPDEST